MMLTGVPPIARSLITCALIASLGVITPTVSAQTHVVSPKELQAAVLAAADTRQQHRKAILSLFSGPAGEKALRAAHIDLKQVTAAVSMLNDEELAQIAARARQIETDFAAGFSQRDLIIILIGLVAVVLIIVAVK